MRPVFVLTIALALVSGAVPARPQDRAAEPAASRRISFHVLVTDSTGGPPPALRPDDLTLLIDGAPQAIEQVRRVAADGEDGRTFAILLDEFHVGAGAPTERIRAAVARFVDALRPDDRLVVLEPLQPLTSIHLTADREAARRAIAGFAGRKGDYTPRTPLEAQLFSRAPAPAEAQRAQVVIAALQALVARFARERARGVIVLASDGFAAGTEQTSAAMLRMLRTAGNRGIAIYPVDSRAKASEQTGGAEPTLMQTVAEQTGGVAVPAGGDLGGELARITHDLDARFVVSWQSAVADGKFHSIEMRPARRGLTVRARPGYWAPFPPFRRASLARPRPFISVPSRPVRRSALIDPGFAVRRTPGGDARVTFTWEPDRAYLRSRGLPTPSAILFSAMAPDGTLLFRDTIAAVGVGPDGQRQSAVFDVRAGRIDIDMSILGPDGTVLDLDARSVPVPDFDGGRIVLSDPEIVRTRSALAFRESRQDPDAPPSPSREFSRTERLLVRVAAYGPDGDPATVTARLLNRIGQVMRDLPRVEDVGGVAQFDLRLAPLAPGEYTLEVAASAGSKHARRLTSFRITY